MTRKDLLNLLSIIFLRHSVCASTGPYDVLVPSNNGETPSLRCEFVSSAATFDRLTWTKDGIDKFVLIRDCRDTQITSCNVSVTSAPGKFSVRGDLVSGVILQVSRVTMEDDGIYECKAIILNGISITRIRLAVLRRPTAISLLDVGKNSSFNERSIMHVVGGHYNRLNCTIPSSNPSATIAWSFGDVRVIVREQSNHSIASDGPLMASTRAIDIFPTAEDEGKIISCTATHYSLSNALQKNITLNVGRLPESPKDAAVVIASVTTKSFILTWSRSSTGGNPQTYNVVYCKTLEPDQCSEISGIGTTRVKIDNLRPLTFYNVEVKSHNMFGFSEDNDIVEQSTKPPSPAELGIRSVYNPGEGRVDISRPDTALGPLPLGLCFQLVLTSSDKSVDPGAEDSDCVSVDESILIPLGWSPKNLALVSYGNNVYSKSSKIFGTAKGKDIVVHLAYIIRTGELASLLG
eukprot:XP_011678120.1 PREDICTED: protein sidekick-1-like [Strongylocentrotus purpuratus]